jgi:hypothetical protein
VKREVLNPVDRKDSQTVFQRDVQVIATKRLAYFCPDHRPGGSTRQPCQTD